MHTHLYYDEGNDVCLVSKFQSRHRPPRVHERTMDRAETPSLPHAHVSNVTDSNVCWVFSTRYPAARRVAGPQPIHSSSTPNYEGKLNNNQQNMNTWGSTALQANQHDITRQNEDYPSWYLATQPTDDTQRAEGCMHKGTRKRPCFFVSPIEQLCPFACLHFQLFNKVLPRTHSKRSALPGAHRSARHFLPDLPPVLSPHFSLLAFTAIAIISNVGTRLCVIHDGQERIRHDADGETHNRRTGGEIGHTILYSIRHIMFQPLYTSMCAQKRCRLCCNFRK